MHPNLARYAIPFAFGRRPERSARPALRGATCVAVDLGDHSFLLTAHHVVQRALEVLDDPETGWIAGPLDLSPRAEQVNGDEQLDLGTILIDRRDLGACPGNEV